MATVAGCRPRPPSVRWLGRGEPAVVVLAAVVVAVAVWRRSPVDAGVAVRRRGGAGAPVDVRRRARRARRRRRRSARSTRSPRSRPIELGAFSGWATVAADPAPGPRADAAAARRSRASASRCGCAAAATQPRVGALAAGRSGVGRRATAARSTPARPARVAVAARRRARSTSTCSATVVDGRPLATSRRTASGISSNAGTSSLPPTDAALARGLIIGDDRDQPPAMIDRFRRSGLSHLTAVSGQNVALVLAAAGPLLRRARPGVRLAATLGADRLVRRADPGRAVGAAGRGDGRAGRRRRSPSAASASRRGCSPWP